MKKRLDVIGGSWLNLFVHLMSRAGWCTTDSYATVGFRIIKLKKHDNRNS